jgi:gamma-glutamylputrescine oxidase
LISDLRYQLSHWEKEAFFKVADLTIIGSGIVGLNAALKARELAPRSRIIILERGPMPIGASTRNAGFACFGSPSELLDDLTTQDEETVFQLVRKRWQGLKCLRNRVGDAQMKYKNLGGFEVFRSSEQATFEKCADYLPELNKRVEEAIGKKKVYQVADATIQSTGLEGIAHMIVNKAEGQLHPGMMMQALMDLVMKAGIEIYYGVRVSTLEDTGGSVAIGTDYGWELKSNRVLIATNGFASKLMPALGVKPARNQVLITSPISDLRLRGCYHYDRGYFYFRNVGNRILLGGGRHLTKMEEETYEFGSTPLIKHALESILREIILPDQEVAIESWWSGILGVGSKKVPLVKMVSDHIGVAVRLGGMGVAIGSLVGEEGAQMMLS